VQFLRSTSVAVRPDADRLNYRTADQIYVPGFGIRTVDDAGGLHGNSHQIDVWIGQGDSAVKAEADAFGIRTRTCLKILNQ
jgi:3D (Asp-Asp-Asp) domain-containing protein